LLVPGPCEWVPDNQVTGVEDRCKQFESRLREWRHTKVPKGGQSDLYRVGGGVAVEGGKKEKRNVCSVRAENKAKQPQHSRIVFLLPFSHHIAFLIRRPTPHQKPTLQQVTVGYARATPTPSATTWVISLSLIETLRTRSALNLLLSQNRRLLHPTTRPSSDSTLVSTNRAGRQIDIVSCPLHLFIHTCFHCALFSSTLRYGPKTINYLNLPVAGYTEDYA